MLTAVASGENVDSTDVTPEQAKQWALWTPKPKYPYSARLRYIVGFGMFGLVVQIKTGLVKEVRLLRTTGDKTLDSAAVKTLQQWRFKPGVIPSNRHDEYCYIRVPVNFSMPGVQVR